MYYIYDSSVDSSHRREEVVLVSGGDCMEISKQNKIGSALLSIRSGRKMAFGRDDGVILNNISGSHIFFSCTMKSGIPQP